MPARRKRREELVDDRRSRVESVSKGDLAPLGVVPKPGRWPVQVKRIWESLFSSGQSVWLQDSDVAFAWYACDYLAWFLRERNEYDRRVRALRAWEALPVEERVEGSRPVVGRGPSPMLLAEINKMLGSLLLTESDRRAARIELGLPKGSEGVSAGVVALSKYREALKG